MPSYNVHSPGYGVWTSSELTRAEEKSANSVRHGKVPGGLSFEDRRNRQRSDHCKQCGLPVEFDTDGNGHLVAFEAELHRRHLRHPCQGA